MASDHEFEQQSIRMRDFNLWGASLPRTDKVTGVYADGTEVTVTVPSIFA